MNAMAIAGGAPAWVYGVLVLLIVLGVRRLRPREVPLIVALIPLGVFLTWSIAGAVVVAARAGTIVALVAWFGGIAIGAALTGRLIVAVRRWTPVHAALA